MIVAICKVCKGPISDKDLVVADINGFTHLMLAKCEYFEEEIARADHEFLEAMAIDPASFFTE